MAINYWNKDKKTTTGNKKKRINWQQSLQSTTAGSKSSLKIKKSLQYILLLKKFDNVIDYKNVKLLKRYVSENGKILPSRITNVSQKKQRELSLSIKRARNLALI